MLAVDVVGIWTQYVWPILLFGLGLGLVVFVHEFGHFIAAKWAGVKVEKFSLGFGPKLFGFQRGETQYRLSLIPLGGYVGMLGQDDFDPMAVETADPRSWQRTPAGKKLIILSAGVVMNVILSVLIFVAVYTIGIRFTAPVVGGTQPGMPAATVVLPGHVAEAMGVDEAVGLEPGDRITAINGRHVRRFTQILMAALLSDTDEKFTLTVVRSVNGRDVEFDVTLVPKKVTSGPLRNHFFFGLSRPTATVIGAPGKEGTGYAGAERFRKGDRIVAVAGAKIASHWDYQRALRDNAGRQLLVTVRREDGEVDVTLLPLLVYDGTTVTSDEQLVLLGMSPRVMIPAEPKGKSPAGKAGIRKGDVIARYGKMSVPSRAELLELNKKFADKEVPIRVERDGKVLDLLITPTKDGKRVLIGIASWPEQDRIVVAAVAKDSPAARAGIPENALITRVNDTPVATWAELYAGVRAHAGEKLTLTYRLGEQETTAELGELRPEDFQPDRYSFSTLAIDGFEQLRTKRIHGNPLQAIAWSVVDTTEWMASVPKTLRNLTKGRASPKSLSGPVGIGAIAIAKGREGVVELTYFMAMLSALVAVFNFLPLPVLDGGHVVLTLIEKVRGRPLPPKLVAGIQITGLVLILGLMLALTYQDIMRFVFGRW